MGTNQPEDNKTMTYELIVNPYVDRIWNEKKIVGMHNLGMLIRNTDGPMVELKDARRLRK